MRFDEIIGLEKEKKTLVHGVKQNHVAHALLFHGAVGSGNLALALAFGAYLNCENPGEFDACGECGACNKMNKLIHPDVTFVFPTAGGKKVLSENFLKEWREFVLESPYQNSTDWFEKIGIKQGNIPVEEARKLIGQMSLKPFEGGYKLVYIWLPEYLSIATANALLKLLEEPPEKTIFLLVCNDAQNLLTTILSRAQRFAVPKFSDEDIVQFFLDSGLPREKAEELSVLAEGSMHAARSLVSSKNEGMHTWFADWMRQAYAFKLLDLVPMADIFDGKSKEEQKQILTYGLRVFREIFLVASGNDDLVKLDTQSKDFVRNFAKVFNVNNLDVISQEFDTAIFHIDRNVRAKIVFLDLSLFLARHIK
ncbi:DNA polymerase III subunit delta [Marinilongibacter aquaticus]|uniref:DNA polymerase III subunit n=1 Tax=Marinilongibacter aquaticus TaxID=2975157 RepID=UPI0021BDCDD2|nr:DNA polymerase III subunit delta [Marinilongibacter aquaticus]UBM60640.1 DNA polymerase III subunit delta [Marinilongibacter aquaticus]